MAREAGRLSTDLIFPASPTSARSESNRVDVQVSSTTIFSPFPFVISILLDGDDIVVVVVVVASALLSARSCSDDSSSS